MIATVVREYKWSPEIVGDLFFDAQDYLGLEFWVKDVEEMIKKAKEAGGRK